MVDILEEAHSQYQIYIYVYDLAVYACFLFSSYRNMKIKGVLVSKLIVA